MFFLKNLFLLNMLHVALAVEMACPSGYRWDNTLWSCFYQSTTAATWSAALQQCQSTGGNLVSIHNVFDNWVFSSKIYDNSQGKKSWIGAQKDLNGTWTWTDGTPFDYQNFQRNKESTEHVYLDYDDEDWKPASPTDIYPYFCVSPKVECTRPTPRNSVSTTAQPDLECVDWSIQALRTCRQGWQFSACTGYEYLVVLDKTFDEVEAFCVSQGGHAASIHSDAENDFITNLCCPTWCQDSRAVFVTGGRRMNGTLWQHGFIEWSDGTPSDYFSPYSNWCNDDEKPQRVVVMDHACASGLCGTLGAWDYLYEENTPFYGVCKRAPK